ncbi:hypothetical protein E2C01_101264 [Portunus trituberculatus]|uniref:Uncharacterized protein n=1 Tax=Portunus trituberculatus TaxID=210409 RepID=A0A5B7KFN3_PORTR|nr:hypothetical protein [Portunus trituberculatus]
MDRHLDVVECRCRCKSHLQYLPATGAESTDVQLPFPRIRTVAGHLCRWRRFGGGSRKWLAGILIYDCI